MLNNDIILQKIMEKYLYADLYELEEKHWWHVSKRETCFYLISKFLKSENPKILDVGCGAGKNMETFGRIGKIWGIDIEKESMNYCLMRGLRKIKLASSEKTGYPDNFFNLVSLLDVLEHTEEKKTLTEMRRILKKNGLILITVPAYNWLWSRWDEILHHKRRYNKKQLTGVLEENRFKILEISYMHPYLILPVYIIRFIRSKFSGRKYKSDFQIINPLLNFFLLAIARLQLKLMHLISIPFGTSIICIAKVAE